MNKGFAKELGLSLHTLTPKNLLLGVGIFITLVFFTIILSSFLSYATNSNITGNTGSIFQNTPAPPPIWFYFFVAIIAPIIEEITFRGLLVKRIGIVPSAIIFGLLHSGYYSSIDLVSFVLLITAATVFGILAGYAYKKTNSIYPSIVAHILENSLAILALF
jgi:membrane protease YdiL (CAAX protease family)